jgi:hypothetical protein
MGTNPARPALAAVALVAAGLVLSGCSMVTDLLPKTPESAASTPAAVPGRETDVPSLRVGDCLNDPGGGDVAALRSVPCSDRHDDEVFAEVAIPGKAYPGDDAVTAAAEEGCGSRFDAFAGIPYDRSELDFNYFTPTEGAWAGGDHVASCVINDPAGAVTGTLARAAR